MVGFMSSKKLTFVNLVYAPRNCYHLNHDMYSRLRLVLSWDLLAIALASNSKLCRVFVH